MGITWFQGFCIEFVAAFVFTMANLICKDGARANFFPQVEGIKAGMFGVLTIAMSLCAMIFVAGPHTGAAINPAVAVANHGMSVKLFSSGTVNDHIVGTYGLSGICGGFAAGFFSWAHGWFVNYSQTAHEQPAQNDEEAPKAIGAPATT